MQGSMGSQVVADYVVQFGKVMSSSLSKSAESGENQAVLFSVAGIGDLDVSGDEPQVNLDDDTGEANETAEIFGALGVVARPLPPETSKGQSMHAEVACLRTSDGLIPISTRDLRLKMPGEAPKPGTVALVGYGGGFHSMDPVDDGVGGTIHVIYCPYDFDSDGVAQKAHSIILDPTSGNESIVIAHADGMAVMLFDEKVILKSKTGMSTLAVNDDGIHLSAPKIILAGGTIVGNPLAAVPLLAGPLSPPSTMFFVSP